MDGILLIDKPKGWTSHDVVAKIRGILAREQASVASSPLKQSTENRQQTTPPRRVKVGHTGTLDPLATGLMILVVGKYTKRAQEFSKLDKTYEVTMKLGETSSTGDGEGEITAVNSKRYAESEIREALESFVGETEQVPPAYSAVKVGGQRAYKLARAGKRVELEPRKITINSLSLTDYHFPLIAFKADVSSGTYIRSLCEDIGKELSTGSYMSALRRTRVGSFEISQAIRVDSLTSNVQDLLLKHKCYNQGLDNVKGLDNV